MKSRMPWVVGVLLVCAVGCDNREAERQKGARETARTLEQARLEMLQRGQALTKQLEKGLQPVVDCALERFRKEVEQRYGAAALKQAKITAEAPKLKKSDEEKQKEKGDEKHKGKADQKQKGHEKQKEKADEEQKQEAGGKMWEVTIRYVGKDENGKDVDTQWVALVDLFMGSLVCVSIQRR